MIIYYDRLVIKDEWLKWMTRESKKNYVKSRFGRIIHAVKHTKYGLNNHSIQRMTERWVTFAYIQRDICKYIHTMYYNTKHERFYIIWEKYRYIFSKDIVLITIAPRKRRMHIWVENPLAIRLQKDI
jgi:hypothetical protein